MSSQESLIDIDVSSKLHFQYQTNDGRKIFVYDNLINDTLLENLGAYLTMELGAWKFSLYEPYEGLNKDPSDNVPWVNRVNCREFGQSLLGHMIQKVVMDSAGRFV